MVKTRRGTVLGDDAAPQPAPAPQQQPAPQRPARGGPSGKTQKFTRPANDEEEDYVPVEEDVENNAPTVDKPGNKRPNSADDEGSSQKARKTGAAGPSNRNAATSGPPTGDAASGEQVQSKGKGKGKEKEGAPASNVSSSVQLLPCLVH